ncbi:MAG: DNA/RNA-binding protein AlbA [Thermoprotei archaeon]|nr:DNA/RNA-binding protein AlbA [Thermoprotei archaeon]
MARPHPTNAVLVGKKPIMNYVLAALRMLSHEGLDEVVIKARGANIYRAVEAAERVKRSMANVKIKTVNIYSEEVSDKKGNRRRVSSIEIVFKKTPFEERVKR